MKLKLLILTMIAGLLLIVGCAQLPLGVQDDQLICVPASNITKICEQLGVKAPSIGDEIEDANNIAELDEILDEVEQDTGLEEITGEVVGDDEVVEEVEIIEADYTVTEGDLFVAPRATDPDGDELAHTFSKPLDENGEWQTQAGDAGLYNIDIVANDGENEVSTSITVLVIAQENSAPTIEGVEDLTVNEGDTVTIELVVSDADNDEVVSFISEPVGDDGVWETGFDDAGEYEITVTASDGVNEVSKTAKITVLNINRAPVIDSLTAAQVEEGGLVKVFVIASDPDGDELEISYDSPLGLNGEWQTQVGDAGEYVLSITAFDGELIDIKTISISVNAANLPPAIEGVEDLTVNEGDTVTIEPVVVDPEGDAVVVTISEPVGDDGVWETGFDDAGEYEITVTANDGENQVSVSFTLTVVEKNRPPTFG